MRRFIVSMGLLVLSFAPMVQAVDSADDERSRIRTIADCTFVTYTQGDNNLASFATYNMNDMARIGSNSHLNILVQLDKPNDNGTWRYRIDKGAITLDEFSTYEMGQSPGQELVDMVRWGVTKYPAKKWCINLWNHGSGVIDPAWGRSLSLLDRGILFDDTQQTYLHNNQLREAMIAIKGVIGHNIDMVAMDACLMAMIEIGWELVPSTDYLVASEETIPGEGFPYSGFLATMTFGDPSTPTIAGSMVAAYDAFYRSRISSYTLSAICLSKLGAVKSALDKVVSNIVACAKISPRAMGAALVTSRTRAVSFDDPSYVDICSWLSCLAAAIKFGVRDEESRARISSAKARVTQYTIALKALNTAITAAIAATKASVIAHVSAGSLQQAAGLAIYFPTSSIHPSYPLTKFAQESLWYQFLRTVLGLKIREKQIAPVPAASTEPEVPAAFDVSPITDVLEAQSASDVPAPADAVTVVDTPSVSVDAPSAPSCGCDAGAPTESSSAEAVSITDAPNLPEAPSLIETTSVSDAPSLAEATSQSITESVSDVPVVA